MLVILYVMKRTITKRSTRVPRLRNAGTMTESQFWYMIRQTLREKSRYWKPIALCRKKARMQFIVNGKKKFLYKCAHCTKFFSIENIEVDHIVPAGSLNCAEDLPGFVERLFVEADKLQCLCKKCHSNKSENEKKNI